MSSIYDNKLLQEARKYDTPEQFKLLNFAKYSICKAKGLLRKAFPDYTEMAVDYAKPLQTPLADDALLRDAIDDLLVTYRGIPTKAGKIRKITVNRVLNDIETILNKY